MTKLKIKTKQSDLDWYDGEYYTNGHYLVRVDPDVSFSEKSLEALRQANSYFHRGKYGVLSTRDDMGKIPVDKFTRSSNMAQPTNFLYHRQDSDTVCRIFNLGMGVHVFPDEGYYQQIISASGGQGLTFFCDGPNDPVYVYRDIDEPDVYAMIMPMRPVDIRDEIRELLGKK